MNNIPFQVYTHLAYPFIHGLTYGLFLLLPVVNNAAINIGIQMSVQVRALILLGIYPEMELLC